MKLFLELSTGKICIDDIKRTKRKTIGISINHDFVIKVRAPYWVRNADIENFIVSNKLWIEKKLLELSQKPKPKEKKFVSGETFLFLGKEIKLCLSAGNEFILTDDNELLLPVLLGNNVRDLLIFWYKKQAEKIITERCIFISQKYNFKVNKIKINNAKTRWGSCSKKGNLNFTWRLVMAPLEVIDYVIIHELVHLIHHNHSKTYWFTVAQYMPKYKAYENWLKKNSNLVNI